MKKFLLGILVVLSLPVWASEIRSVDMFADEKEELVSKRGWMFKAGYVRQDEQNWMEFGLGRINLLSFQPDKGGSTFVAGAAAFTFGADVGLWDSSIIIGPKLGMEAHATIFGGRVSYCYYLQDNNNTGVISVEGGLCILSVFYAYVGYNFTNGNPDNPIVDEGGKFSVGLNIPFGLRKAEPVRKIGE